MSESIGVRLKSLRRRRGLSQTTLAQLVGRSERWLRDVENGAVDVWVADARRLAEALRIDVGELVSSEPHGHGRLRPPVPRVPGKVANLQAGVAYWTHALGEGKSLDLERLSAALEGSCRVDSQLIQSLSFVARRLPRQWGDIPCSNLWQLVHGQLVAFQAFLSCPMPSTSRRELESAAAATAAFAGQISIFGGQRETAATYLHLASQLADQAGDAESHALALMFSSHLHSDALLGGQGGDPDQARALLEAAERLASVAITPVVRAWVLLCRAEERAGSGDEVTAWRFVDEAERLYAAGSVPSDGICCHWGPHLLTTYRGHVAAMAARPLEAVRLLESALAVLRPGALMIRSAARADLGRAYAQLGDIELSCDLLAEAFSLARAAGLTGPLPGILRIRHSQLGRHSAEPAVRRLDQTLRATG